MQIFTQKIHWSVIVLTMMVVIEGTAIALLLTDRSASTEFDRGFDSANVSGTRGFTYKDTLVCNIIYTTHNNSGILLPPYDEKTFTITKLDTDAPEFLRQDGKKWAGYIKQYDAEGYITLQMKTSWDSDVIGIDKNTGAFVRTIQGIQGGKFQYAIAQKGYCE